MAPKVKTAAPATSDAEARLDGFIAKFDAPHQALIRALRKAMRKRLRGAYEMVYDNYNFFVIGYAPTEKPSDAIVSIATGASGASLCFLHGARLPDPKKILLGSGTQTRFVRLPSAAMLARPEVEALVRAAVARARVPFPAGRGTLVIRSVSAKQRPRRKAAGAVHRPSSTKV